MLKSLPDFHLNKPYQTTLRNLALNWVQKWKDFHGLSLEEDDIVEMAGWEFPCGSYRGSLVVARSVEKHLDKVGNSLALIINNPCHRIFQEGSRIGSYPQPPGTLVRFKGDIPHGLSCLSLEVPKEPWVAVVVDGSRPNAVHAVCYANWLLAQGSLGGTLGFQASNRWCISLLPL